MIIIFAIYDLALRTTLENKRAALLGQARRPIIWRLMRKIV